MAAGGKSLEEPVLHRGGHRLAGERTEPVDGLADLLEVPGAVHAFREVLFEGSLRTGRKRLVQVLGNALHHVVTGKPGVHWHDSQEFTRYGASASRTFTRARWSSTR